MEKTGEVQLVTIMIYWLSISIFAIVLETLSRVWREQSGKYRASVFMTTVLAPEVSGERADLVKVTQRQLRLGNHSLQPARVELHLWTRAAGDQSGFHSCPLRRRKLRLQLALVRHSLTVDSLPQREKKQKKHYLVWWVTVSAATYE